MATSLSTGSGGGGPARRQPVLGGEQVLQLLPLPVAQIERASRSSRGDPGSTMSAPAMARLGHSTPGSSPSSSARAVRSPPQAVPSVALLRRRGAVVPGPGRLRFIDGREGLEQLLAEAPDRRSAHTPVE